MIDRELMILYGRFFKSQDGFDKGRTATLIRIIET